MSTQYLIALADDSEDDCLFFKHCARQYPTMRVVACLGDGNEVIHYLTGEGCYDDRQQYPLPDLLVLDLHMPQTNGFEVLEWLRVNPFPNMLVAVLTDSMLRQDMKLALQLGAHSFHTKPMSILSYNLMLRDFEMELERHLVPAVAA